MRPNYDFLNKHRIQLGGGFYFSASKAGESKGTFSFLHRGYQYRVISAGDQDDTEWEHVSITKTNNKKYLMPTWDDMCFIKGLFWGEEETVVQFHPKKSEHVDCHPSCLHLWKEKGVDYKLPPGFLVGIKGVRILK